MRVILMLLILAFSGCIGEEPAPVSDDGGASGYTDTAQEQLSGWIFDPAIAPIAGASIKIQGLGIDVASDDEGYYGIDELPVGELLVVIVQADGYLPSSKSITLQPETRSRLNFTLAEVPEDTPYSQVLTAEGIISCSSVVRENGARHEYDCSPDGVPDNRVWEFPVEGDVAGIVIEVVWEPNTDQARDLYLVVETVNFGEFDEVLAEQEGASILRGQVTADDAKRFYSQGGLVRTTVDIGRNVEGEELGAGAGLAFQQSFDIFATVFYVEGPPGDYTIADA